MLRWSGVYFLVLFCSIWVHQAHGASLTVGNLLIVHYDYTKPDPITNKFVADLTELSSVDGSFVQKWRLGDCQYFGANAYGRISFSQDNSRATVFCQTGTKFTVYSLTNPGGVLTSTIVTMPSTAIALSGITDGNDIWLAYNTPSPIVNKLVYSTRTNSFTEILSTSSKRISGLQIINDEFYYGYETGTNSVSYVSTLPKTSGDMASPTVVASPASKYYYAMSQTEAYFITGSSDAITKQKDGASAYTIQTGFTANGVTAQTLNGVRTVYATVFDNVFVTVDSGTAFGTGVYWPFTSNTLMGIVVIGQPPTCSDNKKNQDETDVDCGGICGATCADTKVCAVNGDCLNNYCDANNKCATPTCSDTAMNQNETDVDCGGVCGANCADGLKCLVKGDCQNNYCTSSNLCATPTCSDTVLNQDESDVDCGGSICTKKCDDGKICLAHTDCTNGYCDSNGKCATPTCSDTAMNQDETDIDCGGPNCLGCADTLKCLVDSDCANLYCNGLKKCDTATCQDTVKNLNETDVDCGGYCGATCNEGYACLIDDDCITHKCTNNACAPTCVDGILNQSETDIDCGGTCIKCEISKKCKVNADCVTDYCDNLVCAEPIPVAPPQSDSPVSDSPQSNSPQSDSPQASNTPAGASPKPVQSPRSILKVSTAGNVVIQTSIGAVLALLVL